MKQAIGQKVKENYLKPEEEKKFVIPPPPQAKQDEPQK